MNLKFDTGIAFIKGVENQFKLKPKKVVELVQKNISLLILVLMQSFGSILMSDHLM
jgi:hypothetical protein